MNHFAIYTAVVGNYDEIRQPLVVDSRFDYFLFSNTILEKRIGVWQIKPIEYTNPDQIKIARYVKTHPETLLPDYAATLWMDANIQIVDSWVYERSIELYNQGVQLASVKHPERDCIYEEILCLTSIGAETLSNAKKWYQVLADNKYPRHSALFETGLLFRVPSKSIKEFDECWWQCIENYSRRDQWSFGYVLWKNHVRCDLLMPECEIVRNSAHFHYLEHPISSTAFKLQGGSYSLLRLWKNKKNSLSNSSSVDNRIWWRIFNQPLPLAKFLFVLWSNSIRLKNDFTYYMSFSKKS